MSLASIRGMITMRGPFILALAWVASACAPRTRPGSEPPADETRGRRRIGSLDPTAMYAQAGFITESDPIPFIGSIRFLAAESPDTTLVLVTLSLANRALTFSGEGDSQKAGYQVAIDMRREGTIVKHIDARESVRVSTFRETSRTDESIIFQQYLPVVPGQYVVSVAVRDEGSARNGQDEVTVTVPRFSANTLSSPIPVYEADLRESRDSIPDMVANPRATVVFGRDSIVQLYIEGYSLASDARVMVVAHNDRGGMVWQDTANLAVSGMLRGVVLGVPVSRLGVGRLTFAASVMGSTDTVRTPLFVTFGQDWAISSLDEMINYLRYFASVSRLQSLKDTSAEKRAMAWAAFYRDTDPDPRTSEHEALRDYFNRVETANLRFREEGSTGWLTDRGKVYVTLGDPDQVLEQGDVNSMGQRGRAQIWTYAQHRLQLVFIDQTGFGRWRMTSSGEMAFEAVAARERR
ncbi:MAG: GWxTD domain-containing protein [Anaerolineae bacterium]|nr:GWxTD domain-containing protein [Gemmatimonadaceae bacterium]